MGIGYCCCERSVIPDGGVNVVVLGAHCGGQQGINIEVGEGAHHFIHYNLLRDVFEGIHLCFRWDSSRVVDWIRHLSVVVGLYDKALSIFLDIAKGYSIMHTSTVSSNNNTLLGLETTHNKISWGNQCLFL